MTQRPLRSIILLLFIVFIGCGGPDSSRPDATVVTVWFHSGQESERETLTAQVERFNASQNEVVVEFNVIPEGTYNGQVQAAAVAGDLPDILELDGPFVYNYVWQGHLIPLDALISGSTKSDLLPSIIEQGTFRDKFYGLGTFDSGLGLYARRSSLEAVGARIPTSPEEAWTIDEFNTLLAKLAEHDPDRQVLDLKLNYVGEWYTYAFSPILQSAGGDLIDRSDYQSADGVLNGPASVQAMTDLQSWIQDGYVDPNIDDAAFTGERVAISWSGHWDYPRYAESVGDDLLLLPLPDFGRGSKTGQGSWCWGITNKCQYPEAAAQFLEFLLRADEVIAITEANGAVPATHNAVERSRLYKEGGPLHLLVTQLTAGFAIPRPQTPAYPVITSTFQEAFADIRNGADAKRVLDHAVATIDQDIRDNRGYPQR